MLSFRVPLLSNRAPLLSKGIWVLSYRRGALTRVLYYILSPTLLRGRGWEFLKLPLPARAGGKDIREIVLKRVFTRFTTLCYSISFCLPPPRVVVGVRLEVFLVSPYARVQGEGYRNLVNLSICTRRR